MSQSEVAKLRQEMELTCEAMRRAMYGFSIVSRHDFIRKKYQQLGEQHDQLKDLVGEKEALDAVVDIYNRTVV